MKFSWSWLPLGERGFGIAFMQYGTALAVWFWVVGFFKKDEQ